MSILFRIPSGLEASFKIRMHSSNVFCFKEFVLSNVIASPLMKRLFTPGGWPEVKCVSSRLVISFDVHKNHIESPYTTVFNFLPTKVTNCAG